MAHVITQSCCNDASCVSVCPVNCIHPRPDDPQFVSAEMLYIDAEVCIDCGACAKACPVNAIFPEDDLPLQLTAYTDLNKAYFSNAAPRTDAPVQIGSPASLAVADRPLRVAIIGTGPAGCYAATELLARKDVDAEIHFFDRLPTMYGLVRYGVAPDHQRTKGVTNTFAKLIDHPKVHLHLGVEIGTEITNDELAQHFDAVVYAVGAATDNRLNIPGEDLPGSCAATDFVAWYNGHPDHAADQYDLSGQRAVIIGNGNVALDIARILVSDPEALARTDIADHALEQLRKSNIREVVMVGRRGSAEMAATTPELRALGQLPGVKVAVEGIDDGASGAKTELLTELAQQAADGERQITLRFLASPVEIVGNDSVTGVRLVRNELQTQTDGSIHASATDDFDSIDAGLVLRSVGYRSAPIPGLPFDDARGRLPQESGRVINPDAGTPVPGVYATGWVKRGASGVIGTNRQCALETVNALVDDFVANRLQPPEANGSGNSLAELLAARAPAAINNIGWREIDRQERETGNRADRPRVKLVHRDDLFAAAAQVG